MTTFHSHTDNETHCIGEKDWCVLIRLRPRSIFMITKDNNTRLGPEGIEMFIPLDCEHTHCTLKELHEELLSP
jgi:hypothetical protein